MIMNYNDFVKWVSSREKRNDEFAHSISLFGKELVVSTDGVGTKILVAKELGIYNTIGIDLVAMNVNDILTKGANPVGFLDYIACGEIGDYLKDIIEGIETGCKIAGCKLLGGETALMPDLYSNKNFDLAGFAFGVVHSSWKKINLEKGDIIYGIKSSGIHSNGFTIARKYLPKEFYEEILTPTRIYTKEVEILKRHANLPIMAHITGGGFSNINRVVPDNLKINIDYNSWDIPYIFREIQDRSKMSFDEMTKEFNLGIGMIFIVRQNETHFYEDSEFIKIGYLE
jgi:phosphoribosylformylglycinamidine cyclo-ligase